MWNITIVFATKACKRVCVYTGSQRLKSISNQTPQSKFLESWQNIAI